MPQRLRLLAIANVQLDSFSVHMKCRHEHELVSWFKKLMLYGGELSKK